MHERQRDVSGYCPENLTVERTMLGAEQLEWLFEDLAATKTRWNVLAQQTPFAPFNRPQGGLAQRFIGTDTWDGDVAERQRILDWLVEQRTPNPIVLTGDAHRNRVSNVPPDYRTLEGDPVATEILGTSISSEGDQTVTKLRCDDPNNPHVVFQNNNRGYVRCTVTPDEWTSEFRVVTTVRSPKAEASTLATVTVENGAGAPCVASV